MAFMHRNLLVFQLAAGLVLRVEAVTRGLPGRWWWLTDQAIRSAGSIPLNIAEGSAERGTPQARRYYRIARASAAECDASVHILHRAGLIDDVTAAELESTLNRISAMLHGLLKR
jgi:four helix bundle protein